MRLCLVLAALLATFGSPSFAQERDVIGEGRLFNNDFFGDGSDRWQTGSYVFSHIRGRDAYTGSEAFGDLIEYRFRAQLISPRRASRAPGDRPYVGALSAGAHTHFAMGETNFSVGADVVAVGPQTGLSDLQLAFHDQFDMPAPVYVDDQLGNAIFANGIAAASRTYELGSRANVRAFVEAQAGSEDLMRIGGDVIIGEVAQNDLLLRDVVTGQLYRATEAAGVTGISYVLGADLTSVFDSRYLPAQSGYDVHDTRTRARAGMFWQFGEDVSFYYGATYMSQEFQGQTEGQVVGSLKLNFNF